MIVELGTPVILCLDDQDVWHIPKPATELLAHVEISIDDAMQRHAATWPTLCLHEPGEIFIYGGFVRQRRLCRGCAFLNRQQPLHASPEEAEAVAEFEQTYRRLTQELAA